MDYNQYRENILKYLTSLQRGGFSYQIICDFINSQQTQFVLFRDFFSRFQSKPNYYRGLAKQDKLSLIHVHLQNLYLQNMAKGDAINDLLSHVISSGLALMFEAFLKINRSEESYYSSLTEFYIEDSPAFHAIENNIKHKKQYGWELDINNHGSTFEILSIETDNLFSQSAVVSSKEFWKLFWVDKNTKKLQFKFESLGQKRTYLLSKTGGGNWKIIESMITSPSNRLEPPYIDYTLLKQLSSDDRDENKATVSDFLANNDLLPCIEFIKTIYKGKLPLNQNSILNRIKESCLNSYRLLNTSAINFTVFNSELILLKKQLELIYNGIFLTNK